MTVPAPLRRFGQVAVTFALFAACNKLAVSFEIENGVSILFPATAIAVLSCMTFGPWAAFGIVLGTIVTPWSPNADLPSLTVSGLVSAVEGLIPWAVFRWRRDLHRDLRDRRSFVAFLIFGCTVNTAFSAVMGNLLVVSHPAGYRLDWEEIFVWFIADFSAALLLAVPLLAFCASLFRRSDREPRTLVNALQILSVIVLLGWGAAFSIRTYLTTSLEETRFAQQQAWSQAEETVNRMHSDFLRAAFITASDPQKNEKLAAARRTNEHFLAELAPLVTHSSPELTREFPRIAADTTRWFATAGNGGATAAEDAAHTTGRQILALRSMMERANSAAWLAFAGKRHKITVVATMVDGLVLLILVLATATLLVNVNRPLAQLRAAIAGMREGKPFEAERIEARYVELRSLAETLEETDRALRQREEELQLQTASALAASQHKSDFLAKMSHELRTPLNSIIGFSELLIEQEAQVEPQRRRAFLENVSTSARRLLGLINDLLDISKVEAGKMRMNFERVDLRMMIANSVATIAPLFDRKKQLVDVDLPTEPLMVRADPARVEQVLLNLLSNANKFTPDGGRIEVRSRADAARCRIEIADHGIGISKADQARIFDEFEQVYPRGTLSEGTGLGLALARRFVEAHGGNIEVESALGEGRCFG
jgi:signal transduction histidine kinase